MVARLRSCAGPTRALGLVAGMDRHRLDSLQEGRAFHELRRLVPSERSSGEQRWGDSITKAGSSHGRRLLVEGAWHQRQHGTSAPTSSSARAARTRWCSSAPGVPSSAWAPPLGTDGRPRQAPSEDRRRDRPASSPGSSGRSPPSTVPSHAAPTVSLIHRRCHGRPLLEPARRSTHPSPTP